MSDDLKHGTTDALTREQELAKQGKNKGIEHHLQEWSSGTRGGGKVPEDFGWNTNPKQYQEEYGSSTLAEEADLSKEKYQKR